MKEKLEKILSSESTENETGIDIQIKNTVDSMIGTAMHENTIYGEIIDHEESGQFSDIPEEVISRMKVYHVKEEFREDIKGLKLPQFVIENGYGLFSDQVYELVDRENLRKNFTLADKDTKIDFNSVDAEIAKVDVDEKGET